MSSSDLRSKFIGAAGLLGAFTACVANERVDERVDRAPAESMSLHYASTSGWDLKSAVFGTGAMDEATDVLFATDGLVYVSGYENGQLGHSSVDPSGNARGVIHRYRSDTLAKEGAFLFDASPSAEVIEALAMDPFAFGSNVDIYFAGRTNGWFPGPHGGQFDTIAGWVPPSGVVQKFQYGNARPQHPRRIVVNEAREIIITGNDDIHAPANFVEAWEDPFLLKLRRSGSSLVPLSGWPVQFGTTNSDVLPGMGVLMDAGSPIYVAGTVTSGGGRGMFVKKYESSGALAWHAQQSPSGLDSAAAVVPLLEGDILFAGASYTRMGDESFGEQDLVIRQLGPQGEVRWTKQIGTEMSELITDMAVDSLGNIYVVGETMGSFDPEVQPQGQADLFLLQLSPQGRLMNAFQIGSPGDEYPAAVAVGFDGNVYVAGYTDNRLFPDKNPKGGRDGFLFRVTPPAPPIGTF